MDELASRIRRVRQRRALWLCLEEGLRAGAVAEASIGALALLARRFLGWSAAEAAILLALAALVPLAVATRLRGRWPSLGWAASWLDARAGGGGWVVSAAERPDPAWARRATAAAPEALPTADLRREIGIFLGSALFLVLALAVPLAGPGAPPSAVVHPAEALTRQRAALEEAVILPEPQAEALDRALETLSRADPRAESTLEAADALARELRAAGEAAGRARSEALQALAEGGEPQAALAAAADALGLGENAQSAPAPRLPTELQRALAEAKSGRGEPLEPGAARDLAEALKQALAESGTELVALGAAPGPGEAGEAGEGVAGEGQGGEGEQGPGAGGPSPGGGVAPLRFGEASSAEGAIFQPKSLPAARFADPEHGVLLQEGLGAPEADARGEGAGGALGADPGGAVDRRALSPSQRRAVGGFFGSGP